MTDKAFAGPPALGSALQSNAPEDGVPAPGYVRYVLFLLTSISIVNYVDRQVVNILAEQIKHDLHLADWQLGLMSGLAFAVFYTTLGIPIARLAERASRPLIIGTATLAWCVFTLLCGFAQNFWQLVFCRVGVGVGEAGCTPPAQSLIADYVPKRNLAFALALFMAGNPVGGLVGMAFGGVVADAFGWRTAFLMAGGPGIILGVLTLTTMRETRRKLAKREMAAKTPSPSFRDVVSYLRAKPTFVLLALAMGMSGILTAGRMPFTASFYLRDHASEVAGLAASVGRHFGYNLKSVGFLGFSIGLVFGVGGALGALAGGRISDRLGNRDVRYFTIVPAVSALISLPLYIWAMLTPSTLLSLFLVGANAFFLFVSLGPTYRTVQYIVPPHMRATATALMLFILNLVGQGVGPLLVGAMSDWFNKGMSFGSGEGVRWALLVSTLATIPCALLFWTARKTVGSDEFIQPKNVT